VEFPVDNVERWAGELAYDRLADSLLLARDGCPTDRPFCSEIRALFAPPANVAPAAAVFCIDHVPTICLVEQATLLDDPKQRRNQIRRLCERLWNQNLARAVLVAGPTSFEAWSVDNPKAQREIILERDINAIDDWSVSGLLSGNVLEGRNSWFDPHKRLDKKLLDNITALIKGLSSDRIRPALARELIANVIFVAYLEDREIVSDEYRLTRGVRPIYDLMGERDRRGLEALFDQLRDDFNGDFLQPTSSGSQAWRWIPNAAFSLLHQFLARTVLRSGQTDFWRYDFSQIPIELVSGIYETFLASKDGDERGEEEPAGSKHSASGWGWMQSIGVSRLVANFLRSIFSAAILTRTPAD
jgi:hypothetical protein